MLFLLQFVVFLMALIAHVIVSFTRIATKIVYIVWLTECAFFYGFLLYFPQDLTLSLGFIWFVLKSLVTFDSYCQFQTYFVLPLLVLKLLTFTTIYGTVRTQEFSHLWKHGTTTLITTHHYGLYLALLYNIISTGVTFAFLLLLIYSKHSYSLRKLTWMHQ